MLSKAKGLVCAGALLLPLTASAGGVSPYEELMDRIAELERQVALLGPGTITHPTHPDIKVSMDGWINVAGMGAWGDEDEEFLGFTNNEAYTSRFNIHAQANPFNDVTFGMDFEAAVYFDGTEFNSTSDAGLNNEDSNSFIDIDPFIAQMYALTPWGSFFWGLIHPASEGTGSDIYPDANYGQNVMSRTLMPVHIPSLGGIDGLNFEDDDIAEEEVGDVFDANDGIGGPRKGIRFDSVSYNGLTFHAGAYKNGDWDAALRYAIAVNAMRFMMGIGHAYKTSGDDDRTITSGSARLEYPWGNGHSSALQFAFGLDHDDDDFNGAADNNNGESYYGRAEHTLDAFGIGPTTFAIEYALNQDIVDNIADVDDDDATMVGAGVVQQIPGYGTDIGIGWRRLDLDRDFDNNTSDDDHIHIGTIVTTFRF